MKRDDFVKLAREAGDAQNDPVEAGDQKAGFIISTRSGRRVNLGPNSRIQIDQGSAKRYLRQLGLKYPR